MGQGSVGLLRLRFEDDFRPPDRDFLLPPLFDRRPLRDRLREPSSRSSSERTNPSKSELLLSASKSELPLEIMSDESKVKSLKSELLDRSELNSLLESSLSSA